MAQARPRPSRQDQPNVFPASQYLQERLQERRARNARPKRSRQSDFGPQTTGRDDDIFITEGDSKHTSARLYDSSPLAPDTKHGAEDNSARRRAPGVRQLDEQIDRLNKENFHLKLELDHRRAREKKLNLEIERMRESVQRAEEIQSEHTELLRINSELVDELEKRDKAIHEAVNIIYENEEKIAELEEKIETLEDDRHSVTRASTIHADSGYAGTETHEQAPTPSPAKKPSKTPRDVSSSPTAAASRDLNEVLSNDSPFKGRRQPLFLKQDKPSTQALRTVFLENARQLHPVKSFQSILSRHTSTIEDDDVPLNSPRLSNLSESSFPSLYSPKKVSPDRHAWEPAEEAALSMGSHTRQASISRVSQWIDGHNVLDDTPSKAPTMQPSLGSVRTNSPATTAIPPAEQYRSLNDALASPLFQPLDLLREDLPFRPHTTQPSDSRRSSRTPTSFGGPIFGEPMLSPSPDSAAKNSVHDGSPLHKKALDPYDTALRTAPKQMRSSVELNSAFVSNLEYRKTGLSTVYHAEDALSASSDEEPSVLRHLGSSEYFGYPDGGSILTGTPSRFLKQNKTSVADRYIGADDLSSPEAVRKSARRKSSSAANGHARKPDLTRAGTSPNMPPMLTTDFPAVHGRSPRADLASPVSYMSTSSSSRTTHVRGARPMSPEALPLQSKPPSRGVDRVSASPARPTLTQKTQQLFRRLSSSHGTDNVPDSREAQPGTTPTRPTLPTLTSTPSSAYINVIPKEMRRANGHGVDSPKVTSTPNSGAQTPVSSRTRTASEVRTTTPAIDNATEKKGFFNRRGSFKAIAGLERSKTTTPSNKKSRRRSSVKDAASPGRLAWI
ncbi:hypothetical protein AMS68_004702 [Peltaster fructicola]|uniref:Centrosomin N-terminal motif 1 domain-containing protein n=1 Tax=Peltaster fructicola TaxID=286661 RepID=A0A6H0XX00_9PEZI|nr:hypothetical protein AMS68_004702 [Peltaster fructicola]